MDIEKFRIKLIQELVPMLNAYRHNYYNLNSPTITDKEYDNLFDRLQSLENETSYILSNSPTQTVGYEVVSKLQKRTHPTPLKSLAKTKSIDEINKWKNDKDVLLMLKADGLTVELVYDGGNFIGGYTRGNGEIGEDITHNCRVFKNVPAKIPFVGKLRIVGEAVIHTDDFDKINSELPDEEKYATPRNLCAGSVRQLDNAICAKRNVRFYAFGILKCGNDLFDSKHDNFGWLENLGISIVQNILIQEEKITDNFIKQMFSIADNLNFPVDGLVVSYDSVSYSNSLPETAHHPNHSIAFKTEDETAETILREVEWVTTRSAQINPTAIFDTVILDNTAVNRASLFNLTFIQNMGLNIGCRILVSKRNMIIPYIEENLDKNNGELPLPKYCPSCGTSVEITNTGTADFIICPNKMCPAQLLDRFVHFASRDAMNIDGFSEATIEKFIDRGFLKTFSDIYELYQYNYEIINMEGFGDKSFGNLISAIEKSKEVKLSNFIFALGIPGIGKGGAKILAEAFDNDWYKFENALKEGYDFSQLKDFGGITNDNLHSWYSDSYEEKLRKGLVGILKFAGKEEKKKMGEGIFAGKKIYCTGKFASYKKDELREIVEGLGGIFTSGYAKSLDFLVEGSVKSSSKVDKARKDGITVLSEDEFLEAIK